MKVGTNLKAGNIYRLALLTFIILLMIIRRPEFFTSPRFWAEEGANYFAYAWNHGFLEALFVQHFGYYAIVPTVATAFATLVPLEYAPLLTTLIAALFQILVSSVVIFGNAPLWDTWPRRILLACGIQLINPFEVWLTTIGTQYWMTIALFLIMLQNKESTGRGIRIFNRGMVLIGGLSGAQPLFLAPVYALRAWKNRSREEWILTGILLGAGALQAAAFLSAKTSGDPYMQTRFGSIEFNGFWFLTWHLIEPYVSRAAFDTPIVNAIDMACASFLNRLLPVYFSYISILACLCFVIGSAVSVLVSHRRNPDCQHILSSYLLVTVMSTLLSLNMASSPRYAFAPAIILLTLVVGGVRTLAPSRPVKLIAVLFLLITLLSATRDIRSPLRIHYSKYLPVWSNEVSSWRKNPGHTLMIWPQFVNRKWGVNLKPRQ